MTPEQKKARAEDLRLQRLYGITLKQRQSMERKQKNKCAICGRPPKKLKLAVDHNHKTGKVRGLLCMICNRKVIGILERFKIPVKEVVRYFMKYDPENPVIRGKCKSS